MDALSWWLRRFAGRNVATRASVMGTVEVAFFARDMAQGAGMRGNGAALWSGGVMG